MRDQILPIYCLSFSSIFSLLSDLILFKSYFELKNQAILSALTVIFSFCEEKIANDHLHYFHANTMNSRVTGTCCLGTQCKFQAHELCPEHKCICCRQIIHVMCAVWDAEREGHRCPYDCGRKLPPTAPAPSRPPSSSCPKCGQTSHRRSSSKLCPFYKPRNVNRNQNGNVVTLAAVVEDVPVLGSSTEESSSSVAERTNGEKDELDMTETKFIYVGMEPEEEARKQYKPVVDVANSDVFKKIDTIFRLNGKNDRNRTIELVPSPKNLVMKYYSHEFMQLIVNASNQYREMRLDAEPELNQWRYKTDAAPFTLKDVYHFFAIIYYMGVIRLPEKDDYWSTEPLMPVHELCHQHGMTRNRFRFLWRHIHLSVVQNTEEDDEDEDERQEMRIDQVQRNDNESEDYAEADEVTGMPAVASKVVWFEKLRPFVNHFRDVSEGLIHILGTNLSIDEMIVRFRGRSNETHRIKNKPIGEGYKFFTLSTTDGFIVNFTLDGRVAAKKNELEYSTTNRGAGKIESMLLHVFEVIERLKEKQKNRIERTGRVTRNNEGEIENRQNQFIVAMDNYFSLPKVIGKLREMGVGMVGTSRFKPNWPPKSLKAVDVEKSNFNEFYWLIDEHGTLVSRWKDNGMVLCCSTVHRVGNTIERLRRKPRLTTTNSSHVKQVWGDNGTTKIKIPTLIDDYNHWMGGVDMSDQLIAYYHPNLRCYRTWIPMFLQIVSMIRCNCYLVYKSKYRNRPRSKANVLSHKQFTLAMVDELLKKAEHYHRQKDFHLSASAGTTTSSSTTNITTKTTPLARRSITMIPTSIHHACSSSISAASSMSSLPDTSSTASAFFTSRFEKQKHRRVRMSHTHNKETGKRKRLNKVCRYCSDMYLAQKKSDASASWDRSVKRTEMGCEECGVFLCAHHFYLWHEENL